MKGQSGEIYLCLRSNRKQGIVKGKHYVYDSGELRTYTTRNVTCLINGDELLALPNTFELATKCPFCGCQTMNPFPWIDKRFIHDGIECAAEWDAKVKGYERV